jgi:hypothetical protein
MSNPWIVQPPKAAFASLPVGFYLGKFVGVEEVTLKTGESKWRFAWEVKSGAEAGKLATALTDRSISPTTLPGVLISGLLGRAIVAGENVKDAIDACKGKVYMVSVAPGPKGGKPCVRTVGPPPQM